MPRSYIHESPRWFHYGSNPTDDSGNDNFRSPIRMHNASTTTCDYGCNTEIYGLIQIATDDTGSYLWLILCQIRKCVTWALCNISCFYSIPLFRKVEHVMSVQSQTCQCSHIHVSAVTFKYNSNYIESIVIMYLLFMSDYAIMKY